MSLLWINTALLVIQMLVFIAGIAKLWVSFEHRLTTIETHVDILIKNIGVKSDKNSC